MVELFMQLELQLFIVKAKKPTNLTHSHLYIIYFLQFMTNTFRKWHISRNPGCMGFCATPPQ